jgi:S-adenosylmethionine hydrolase
VIDPGVGTERKAMIARSKRGQFFVLPDNGLLTLVADRQGLAGAREIVNPRWMLASARSSTFHGRDVFSPAAAHVAHGADWTQAGPPIAKPVRLDIRAAQLDGDVIRGTVIATDGPYGNLLTDIDATLFLKLGWTRGDTVPVEIGGAKLEVPFARTFGDVPEGKPLLYVDSRARMGLALNLGNFAETNHVTIPSAIVIHRK